MNATSATIAIGRGRATDPNYVASPMWAFFKSDVKSLASLYGPVVSVTYGISDSEGWGEEESYTVVVAPVSDVTAIRSRLVGLATLYGQDTIALTVGETDLVQGLQNAA